MIYKAISLHQPWANMIADGKKTIETRCWPTSHRGDLLIVSTRKPVLDARGQFIEPRGCAVALVDLYVCRPMTADDVGRAGCACYPGAYAWVLGNIRRIVPIPVRGRHRLYEVNVDRLVFVETT